MKTKEITAQLNGFIKLPPALRKGKIFIIEDDDFLTIKKIKSPSLSEIRRKLKTVSSAITEKEIEQEIQNYRKGK